MIMVTDLETSGLPHKELPYDDPSQPWIVSAAAMLLTMDGNIYDQFHFHVDADGRKISKGAEAVHGISSRQAGLVGMHESVVYGALCHFARQSVCICSFGDFDRDMVCRNLMRMKKPVRLWDRPGVEFINVMKAAAAVTKIPFDKEEGRYYSGEYRWPNLEAAIRGVLNEEPQPEKLHNAWIDCEWCRKMLLNLADRGAIEIPTV